MRPEAAPDIDSTDDAGETEAERLRVKAEFERLISERLQRTEATEQKENAPLPKPPQMPKIDDEQASVHTQELNPQPGKHENLSAPANEADVESEQLRAAFERLVAEREEAKNFRESLAKDASRQSHPRPELGSAPSQPAIPKQPGPVESIPEDVEADDFKAAFGRLAEERGVRKDSSDAPDVKPKVQQPEPVEKAPSKSFEEAMFSSAFQSLAAERKLTETASQGVPPIVPNDSSKQTIEPVKPKDSSAPPKATASILQSTPSPKSPSSFSKFKIPDEKPMDAGVSQNAMEGSPAEKPVEKPKEDLKQRWRPEDVSPFFEKPGAISAAKAIQDEMKGTDTSAPFSSSGVKPVDTAADSAEAEVANEVSAERPSKKAKKNKQAKKKKEKESSTRHDGRRNGVSFGLEGLVAKGRDVLKDLGVGVSHETATITLEHGYIKLMLSKKLEVLDYRVVEVNPRLFREGIVSDPRRMSSFLRVAVGEMQPNIRNVLGVVPGYQTRMQNLILPKARGMDPAQIVPREAQRTMGISADTSYLAWQRLPDTLDNSQWMVLSATKRSVSTLTTTLLSAGLKLTVVELRPLALARAINKADAIIAWAAADGCEAIVVRDWLPMSHQAAYWGAEPPVEGDVLVNRITEVTERAVITYDQQYPNTPLPEDTPLFVTGTPIGKEPDIASRVATALGRQVDNIEPSMEIPEGFPIHDMIVNVGLSLWSA